MDVNIFQLKISPTSATNSEKPAIDIPMMAAVFRPEPESFEATFDVFNWVVELEEAGELEVGELEEVGESGEVGESKQQMMSLPPRQRPTAFLPVQLK